MEAINLIKIYVTTFISWIVLRIIHCSATGNSFTVPMSILDVNGITIRLSYRFHKCNE